MLNRLLSIKIKNRIKLIHKVAQNPIYYQNKLLSNNLKIANNTLFGKTHKFNDIKNYRQFSQNIPLYNYNDLKQYIDKAKQSEKNILWPGKTKWFAKSSGTTNYKSKFIPITDASLRECHFKGGRDMLAIYLHRQPKSKLFSGKSLIIGGSTELTKTYNYHFGDLSAIIINNLPIWTQLKCCPSKKTALLKNWEYKIEKIIQESSKKNITSISGVPSWTMIIIKKLMTQCNISCLTELWPNLELYIHGGVSFINYHNTFNDFIKIKKINYMETYNASEGFFGIQDQKNKSDLLLLLNHGVFYEFIPIENGIEREEKIISLESVELNKIYAMVISTNGGLWRYRLGDTIKFTSLQPYRIIIQGRTTSFINAFGEELNEHQANHAIQHACEKTNAIIQEYVAGPVFYNNNNGCHEWFIEFIKQPNDIKKFKHELDFKLKKLNSDYESKRFKSILMKLPKINIVDNNFFYDLLKKHNKLGGQNKLQKLHNNRLFTQELHEKYNC